MSSGMLVNIYRDRYDCTNGGVSSKSETAIMVGVNVAKVFDSERHSDPVLVLKSKMSYKNNAPCEYLYLEPEEPVKKGNVGYMFGGNFAYSSDSRFPSLYPIPIHDRQETVEQYRALSS